MDIEEWLEKNKFTDSWNCEAVYLSMLREFMKGKVVVNKETVFMLRECLEAERIRWRYDLKKCASDKVSVDRINIVLADLTAAYDDLGQALQPASSEAGSND